MKYSVLMSVYGKEKPENLQQAIESILNQTIKTDDFVLVCDGILTDMLEAVINQYIRELHIVRMERNEGLGNALNMGLKHCRHELVARMDSDDISVEDRMEKQLAAFEGNSNLDIVSGTVAEFETLQSDVTGLRRLPCTHTEILQYSKKRCPFNHPCVMIKKTAAQDAGGYNGRFRMEDYYLWIRMLQNGSVSQNLPEVLLYMRTSSDLYMRRGGYRYAGNMLKFHWWMHKSGWSSLSDFCLGAVPHAAVCMMPNKLRSRVYKKLHCDQKDRALK